MADFMSDLSALGIQGAHSAASLLTKDASEFGNDASLECHWASMAYRHAETYFKLISAVDASKLRLTNFDDDIYRQFKRYFKNLKVDVVDRDVLKSEDAKIRWRPFCNMYEDKINDFNFATLLRLDCKKEYTEENTILVTRIQFYAIEVARNRRGLNKCHSEKRKAEENQAGDSPAEKAR